MLPTLDQSVDVTCRCTPLMCLHSTLSRFQGCEIPKPLPYQTQNINAHSQIRKITACYNLPKCTLVWRNYRLKLYSDLERLPSKYQGFQLSPQPPDTSRCPQQPTCPAHVRPLRAAHARDFHPFTVIRVRRVTTPPVSVSPNPSFIAWWIGSKDGITPSSALRLPHQLY